MPLSNEIIDERLKNRNIKRLEDYPGKNNINMKFQHTIEECCYKWLATVDSICGKSNSCCPECNQPGINHKLITKLFKTNNINCISEYKLSEFDQTEMRKLRFDWGFPELNLVIEFDGKQHFEITEFK